MAKHICVVVLVAFAVDGLLLLGAAKVTGWQGKDIVFQLLFHIKNNIFNFSFVE